MADHYVFVCRHQRQTIRAGQPLAQGIDQITNAALMVSKSGILNTTDPIVIVWALLSNTTARARVQRVLGSMTHGVTLSRAGRWPPLSHPGFPSKMEWKPYSPWVHPFGPIPPFVNNEVKQLLGNCASLGVKT